MIDKKKIFNLEKLTKYQKDSIVSKIIISEKIGSVTLFAFDKNQGLSEHTAPFDALAYILDGNVKILIDGDAFNLEKGDFIIMPANKPHALKALSKFKMVLIMMKS